MRKTLTFGIVSLLSIFVFVNCGDGTTEATANAPEVGTADVSDITATTAQCGGTVSSDGGAAVTARGVSWSTTQDPTISDYTTDDGVGVGSFTSSITGLTAATPYYVRAYATNSAGTGYGSAVSFTTAAESVTDVDGNVYQVVTIGSQVWMAENLQVTHYRNGDPIPNVTDDVAWENLTTGAYSNFANSADNAVTYGRLYNWYAVNDSRNLAPEGWHVPSDDEWKELEMYLGMSQVEADATGWRGTDEGGKLKETGTTHWDNPNIGATNESGFSALPGGSRGFGGNFISLGYETAIWSSTESTAHNPYAWYRYLTSGNEGVTRGTHDKRDGFSVRCVRN